MTYAEAVEVFADEERTGNVIKLQIVNATNNNRKTGKG